MGLIPMANYYIHNLETPICLCQFCWRNVCYKNHIIKKDSIGKERGGMANTCNTYLGPEVFYAHNIKHVSREDFVRFRNEGFHLAKRLLWPPHVLARLW